MRQMPYKNKLHVRTKCINVLRKKKNPTELKSLVAMHFKKATFVT